jgi:cell division protease FtsH
MIAREMLTTYGFSCYNFDYRNMSGEAARLVDMEIDRLVDSCYKDAKACLETHRHELEVLKEKLIEEEIVDGQWVYELMNGTSNVSRLWSSLDEV